MADADSYYLLSRNPRRIVLLFTYPGQSHNRNPPPCQLPQPQPLLSQLLTVLWWPSRSLVGLTLPRLFWSSYHYYNAASLVALITVVVGYQIGGTYLWRTGGCALMLSLSLSVANPPWMACCTSSWTSLTLFHFMVVCLLHNQLRSEYCLQPGYFRVGILLRTHQTIKNTVIRVGGRPSYTLWSALWYHKHSPKSLPHLLFSNVIVFDGKNSGTLKIQLLFTLQLE